MSESLNFKPNNQTQFNKTVLTLTENIQISAFLVRRLSKAFFNSQNVNGDRFGNFYLFKILKEVDCRL